MSKPKVAFFDFTCCEGCQLQVLSLEDELLPLLDKIEIVNFREASSASGDDYAIAIIEGAISRESEIPRLQKIRRQAAILITLGACSHIGGVNCIKNFRPMEEALDIVYKDKAKWYDTIPARPASAVVKVDFDIPCCPIDKHDFLKTIQSLLSGQIPRQPRYPVCTECRRKGNICMFDKGRVCLGPVTRGGCGAICPSYGNYCMGCRGLIDDANLYSQTILLRRKGLNTEEIMKLYSLFDGYYEDIKNCTI